MAAPAAITPKSRPNAGTYYRLPEQTQHDLAQHDLPRSSLQILDFIAHASLARRGEHHHNAQISEREFLVTGLCSKTAVLVAPLKLSRSQFYEGRRRLLATGIVFMERKAVARLAFNHRTPHGWLAVIYTLRQDACVYCGQRVAEGCRVEPRKRTTPPRRERTRRPRHTVPEQQPLPLVAEQQPPAPAAPEPADKVAAARRRHEVGQALQWWMATGGFHVNDHLVNAGHYPDDWILGKIMEALGPGSMEELGEVMDRQRERGKRPYDPQTGGPYNFGWWATVIWGEIGRKYGVRCPVIRKSEAARETRSPRPSDQIAVGMNRSDPTPGPEPGSADPAQGTQAWEKRSGSSDTRSTAEILRDILRGGS